MTMPALPTGVDAPGVFRSLFLSYPDSLLLVERSGNIVLANPSAAALLGYTPGELIGLNVDKLLPDALRSRHAAHREGYGREPKARPMGMQTELVARRKDGSEVMVEIALSPLQQHGLPLVVAAIRDIGAYPRVKQALQRARYSEHLAQLGRLAVDARDPQVVLDQVPVIAAAAMQLEFACVFLLDADRALLRVASGVGSMPGREVGSHIPFTADTLPGLALKLGRPVVVPELRHERSFQLPPAALAQGLSSAMAVPLIDRGRPVGAIGVASMAEQRFGADEVRFLESLANLLATSLQRAHSEEALKHAQRLESVGQLTGGIAHDFNNLLTVIQGNLQVLAELPALADDGRAQQLVAAAARASRRGADLTHQLLAFARRQVLQPSAVDVLTLLQALADMLRRTLDQRIRIEVVGEPHCPPVLADAGQLEAALLNIAINARDAMPGGGVLRFRCEPRDTLPLDKDGVLPEEASAAGYVAISVVDSGTGMSEAVRERAFEPFFTTKDAGRGTGLGLSTVYGFVKQSQGAVTIDSTPDAGTTLTMVLPQAPVAAVSGDDGEAVQALPDGLRVLLVEDDAEVAAVIAAFLEALHCRVTLAGSGEQALLVLGSPVDFDVLLTDIALGAGMRGTELAALAVQRSPGLAVLLMSGYSAELLAADREVPEHWDLLRKPCSREDLAGALSRVVMH
jgi:PAS domain S-box-containing protein